MLVLQIKLNYFSAGNIVVDKDRIKIPKNKIAKYTTKAKYVLDCYNTGEYSDDDQYVSILSTIEGSNLASIKGINCTLLKSLNQKSFMSVREIQRKSTLTLGTRARLENTQGSWCQYDISLDSGEVKLATEILSSYRFFRWMEVRI